MKNYKLAVLKGDGIGPEIVDQAIQVLNKTAQAYGFSVSYDYALLGGAAIDATGVPLPQETIDACKAADSVLLGAVGGPKWDSLAITARRRDFWASAKPWACTPICALPLFSPPCGTPLP